MIVPVWLMGHILAQSDIFAVSPKSQPMSYEGFQQKLQFPEDEGWGFDPNGIPQYASPCGWTVKVVLVMERLMGFFTELYKILSPSLPCPEVGIFGIKLEPIPVCQAVEHGIDHVVQLNEEPTVNANMVD